MATLKMEFRVPLPMDSSVIKVLIIASQAVYASSKHKVLQIRDSLTGNFSTTTLHQGLIKWATEVTQTMICKICPMLTKISRSNSEM